MGHPNPLPPIERLNELFYYDAERDCLCWRQSTIAGGNGSYSGNPHQAGSPVLGSRTNGYREVSTKIGKFRLHRLAWAICHQRDPYPLTVDHKNRNRSDNRIGNLRLADDSQQRANSVSRNATGFKNVFRTRTGRFVGSFVYRGKFYCTVTCDTAKEASDCVTKLDISVRGEFAVAVHSDSTPAPLVALDGAFIVEV